MMKKAILSLGLAVALGAAQQVVASPIDAATMDLTELQNLMDSRTLGGSSSIDVNADESQSEQFAFQSTGASATYVATVSYAYPINFGLYDVNNPGTTVTLFNTIAGSEPGDSTQIYISYSATTNTVTTYYFDASCPPPLGICLLGSASFSSPAVGFYVTSVYGTYYSESDRNAATYDVDGDGISDNDHFLTYMGQGDYFNAGGTGSPYLNDFAHWYIAAEATHMGDPSSNDFTDIIVQIESLQPVPEPGTLTLLGAGLFGLAAVARRRRRV